MSSGRFATLTPENAAAQKCLALLVDRDRDRELDRRSPINRVVASQTNLEPASSCGRAAKSKHQLVLSFGERGGGPGDSLYLVACKTIHCQQREIASVKNEIILALEIPPTAVCVVPVLYTWCEHGPLPPVL